MVVINKIVGGVFGPWGLGMLLLLMTAVAGYRRQRRWTVSLLSIAVIWVWFFSTLSATRMLGLALEGEFLVNGQVPSVESLPSADAIVLLGGGMGTNADLNHHPEMWTSADRVWHAARLYHAGKAPRIIATGGSAEFSTRPLLIDLGVATNAMNFSESARNTEEEAKAIQASGLRRVLLVTSAWHMRRALLMFAKYAPQVEVVAAPADFEAQTLLGGKPWSIAELVPSAEMFAANAVAFKEIIAYWGYRILR